MFSTTFTHVFKFFVYMLLGFVLGKTKRLPENSVQTISQLVVNLLMLAMLITSFYQNCTLEYLSSELPLLGLAVLTTGAEILLAMWISRYISQEPYERNVCTVALAVPNTSYVGTPLVLELFGSNVLMRMLIFTLPLSAYLNSEGYRLLLGQKRIRLKNILNPMVLAMLVGAAFGILQIPLPKIAEDVLLGCGNCVAPLSMILTGCTLSAFDIKELLRNKKVYIVVAIRMLLIPAIVLSAASCLGLSQEMILILAAVNTMPVCMATVVFPAAVGRDCRLGAGLVCVSNLLAILTVPLFFHFFAM